jgi:hypothetical protein
MPLSAKPESFKKTGKMYNVVETIDDFQALWMAILKLSPEQAFLFVRVPYTSRLPRVHPSYIKRSIREFSHNRKKSASKERDAEELYSAASCTAFLYHQSQ